MIFVSSQGYSYSRITPFLKKRRLWHFILLSYFSGLSLTRNQREAHMFHLAREVVGEREMTFCEGGASVVVGDTLRPGIRKLKRRYIFISYLVKLHWTYKSNISAGMVWYYSTLAHYYISRFTFHLFLHISYRDQLLKYVKLKGKGIVFIWRGRRFARGRSLREWAQKGPGHSDHRSLLGSLQRYWN